MKRGTNPGEAKTVYTVRQHVPKERGVRVQGREVGVHVGALPVGDTRHDDALDVSKDLVIFLSFMRSRVRE